MARPAVKGQIFDYQDNPIAHCKVGEVFTDENGYFTLSEIRYTSFEVLPMEAPPVFVSEIVEKEGYQTEMIRLSNPYGGGSPKGTIWQAGKIYLKRINEQIYPSKILINKKWKVLFLPEEQEVIGILDENVQRTENGEDKRRSFYDMKEKLSLEGKPLYSTFDLAVKGDSLYIHAFTYGEDTSELLYRGKYQFVSDSIIQVKTDFEQFDGNYHFTEIEKIFFKLKKMK